MSLNINRDGGWRRVLGSLLLACAALSLAACGGGADDDDGSTGGGGGGGGPTFLNAFRAFVGNDDPNNFTIDELFDNLAEADSAFNSQIDEGLVLDPIGNGYRAGISGANGAVNIACGLPDRNGQTIDLVSTDRQFIDSTTPLSQPKGVVLARDAGLLIAADTDAGNGGIKVYSSTAGGDVEALAFVPASELRTTGTGVPWDVAYDEVNDLLFAALTNGEVARLPGFVADIADDGSYDGTIANFRPNAASLQTVSNLHGIAYDRTGDRLVVSDVGDAAVDDDGSIYVFNNAATRTGAGAPDRIIRGGATRLGNPVDLVLNVLDLGDDNFALGVAEKANSGGLLLIFADIFNATATNAAPSVAQVQDGSTGNGPPETIALRTIPDANFTVGTPDVSDLDLGNDVIDFVYITSNPGASNGGGSGGGSLLEIPGVGSILPFPDDGNGGPAPGDDDLIFRVPQSLAGDPTPVFAADFGGTTLENIAFDLNSDAIVTFDDGSTGGVGFINRLRLRDGGSIDDRRDRSVMNSATLTAPKGFDVANGGGFDVLDGGLVIVADFESAAPGNIVVLGACADDGAAPLFTTALPTGVRPWDLDYDAFNDRLYVAATNGSILVYDTYVQDQPTSAAPDRTIIPADDAGVQISVNLHGIQHLQANNSLIVSDVGDAGSATDGQIFVIENANTANGPTSVRARIVGGADPNQLGNPVDIIFDGLNNLFVADKNNNRVLRIDDILNFTGEVTLSSSNSSSASVEAPESVTLFRPLDAP